MTVGSWELAARVAADPWRYSRLWRPLHDMIGVAPGDRLPPSGLGRPVETTLRFLSWARRNPQQRYVVEDERKYSAPWAWR